MKRIISVILSLILIVSCFAVGTIGADAASFNEINTPGVFLKQHTNVTCTLSSAAMLLRRTAIIMGYKDWEEITETNIRSVAWIEGRGLRWEFDLYNMTMGHGYFSTDESGDVTKAEMLSLLEEYPQGIIIYNGGNAGQSHAVLLTDYDSKTDTFYVADPSSAAPKGRITLMESSIVGETQMLKIQNLTAYWFISSPKVTVTNGQYKTDGNFSQYFDPSGDSTAFDKTKKAVNDYYVAISDADSGAALRYYPSGSSNAAEFAKKGSLLYITYSGKNSSDKEWYKTSTDRYVFSGNIMPLSEYSEEIKKFNNTKKDINSTYSVKTTVSKAALRIDPAEGNNTVGYADGGSKLYITASGVNSIGAAWLKTAEGYYIKAVDMQFVANGKQTGSDYNGSVSVVSGMYSATPVEGGNSVEEGKKYYVTAESGLNMRKTPLTGEVLETIPHKTEVFVTEVKGVSDQDNPFWGKVSYNGSSGWISMQYVAVVPDVVVNDPLEIQDIKLSTDRLQTGKSIMCLSVVSGGTGNYTYKVALYSDNGKLVQIFSHDKDSENFLLTYTPEKSGVYYFHVEVTDSVGNAAGDYSGSFTVFDLLQLGSVNSDVDEMSFVGEPIVWSVDTVSKADDAVYCYTVYKNGSKAYYYETAEPEFKYTPTSAGDYNVSVVLKNDHSESDAVESYVINVYEKLNIDLKVNAKTVLTGKDIVCTVEATGGTGGYHYSFSLFCGGVLVDNGQFSSENKVLYTLNEPGTYNILCVVVDSSNMIISKFTDEITVTDTIKGDVDGDGDVTVKDARLALRAGVRLISLSETAYAAADVNGDGKVNAADARMILRHAAKIEYFK